MLNEPEAIDSLELALASALASFRIPTIEFGRPAMVEKAAQRAAALFQGVATAHPRTEDAHKAAHAFMTGQPLAERQYDVLASVLCEPIREQQGAMVVGHSRFEELLQQYEAQAIAGKLWRLTWYGLLAAYFSFDSRTASENERGGWVKLRDMLRRTWPNIDHESEGRIVPDWIKVMRDEPQLLTDTAADKYAADYLDGHTQGVKRLAEDLGILQSSWFWQSLILGAVRTCCYFKDDAEFKTRIPRLLELLNARPVFRDKALELILTRYHQCSSTEAHPQLCDFVVHRDVWRNPKLKDAGFAPAWNLVAEPVWKMVLGWVNEANLKLFFELLAGRSGSDEGRLEFWSRYLKQIIWTRLIFGTETMDLARNNKEIRGLLAQEEGTYAILTLNTDVDAFMMQVGDYLIVEFSKKGNACNVYRVQNLQFDRYAPRYSGGTNDLKYGYRGGSIIRIKHFERWEERAEEELKVIGIYPDKHSVKRESREACELASASHVGIPMSSKYSTTTVHLSGVPRNAKFTFDNLSKLVSNYPTALINDTRSSYGGGRLYVEDPQQHASLATALKRWDFRWSKTRNAWYYPED